MKTAYVISKDSGMRVAAVVAHSAELPETAICYMMGKWPETMFNVVEYKGGDLPGSELMLWKPIQGMQVPISHSVEVIAVCHCGSVSRFASEPNLAGKTISVPCAGCTVKWEVKV